MEFRTRETTEEVSAPIVVTEDTTDHGNQDKAITSEPELSKESELEKWEIQNGKYGLEYFGIKEIGKEFPLSAQFGMVDSYIKQEIKDRSLANSPANWHEVLKELESEVGSEKLNSYERLKRLASLVKIIKKQKDLKDQRKLYAGSL